MVGASYDDDLGSKSGSAYVFQRAQASAVTDAARETPESGSDRPARPATALGSPARTTAGPAPAVGTGLAPPWGTTTRFCIDFSELTWCDGFDLTISGGGLEGFWFDVDPSFFCDPFGVPVAGTFEEGRFVLHCDADPGPCPLDADYRWIFDWPLDGTAIMFRKQDGLWQSWIDELEYRVSAGPCE